MRRKLPLSLRILLGLGLGVLAGLALQDAPEFSAAWIQPFGTAFISWDKIWGEKDKAGRSGTLSGAGKYSSCQPDCF